MSLFEKICVAVIVVLAVAVIIGGGVFLGRQWLGSAERLEPLNPTAKTGTVASKTPLERNPSPSEKSVAQTPSSATPQNVPPMSSKRTFLLCGIVREKQSGNPVGGARVDALFRDEYGARNSFVLSDSDGRFTLQYIPQGVPCVLTVSKEGFAPHVMNGLVLENDCDVGVITLEGGVTVGVMVVDTKSHLPVEGASIMMAKRVSIAGQTEVEVEVAKGILTNSKGKVALPPLGDGTYILNLSKEGYVPHQNFPIRIEGGRPSTAEYKISLTRKAK